MTPLLQGNPQGRALDLPRHVRPAGNFQATFGRSAEDALASMNDAGDDIPNQAPRHAWALARVGVTRTSIPVVIANPFDAGGTVPIACTVDAHVGLSPGRRGIHVSRIGHVLADLARQPHDTLQHYAVALCDRLAEVQQCDTAEVAVSGVLSYVEQGGGAARRASIEHLTLSADARRAVGLRAAGHSVAFNHTTACPCVQQTYRHGVLPLDGARYEEGVGRADARFPRPTHTQRCHTRVAVSPCESPVSLVRLLAVVDQVVVRCQNTLPRDLELLAVHRAHVEPQFLEDVLRQLLAAVHRLIREDHPGATIRIHATSMESIHDFDLSGDVAASVRELDGAWRRETA